MPRHKIEITLPSKPLKNVDTVIAAWSDGQKLGELRISKGTIDWRGAGKKEYKYITWERFAELMNAEE